MKPLMISVHPIVVENGTFSWGPDETPALTNITLRVETNRLVAVVGPVASGKSSLIACLLGEMDRLCGRVNTKVLKTNLIYFPFPFFTVLNI